LAASTSMWRMPFSSGTTVALAPTAGAMASIAESRS